MRRNVCRSLACLLTLTLSVPTLAPAQDRVDLTLVSRIKQEAFDRSQVMETVGYLTDVYGPRLTASPELKEASDWAVKRLQSFGIADAHLEKWGEFARGWSLKQSSLEMMTPRYSQLDAAPLAWSDVTKAPVTADAIYAPYGGPRQTLDPKKLQAELDDYIATWKGKLKGKVVLIARPRDVVQNAQPAFQRYTDKDLSDRSVAPLPEPRLSDVTKLEIPDDPEEERELFDRLPQGVRDQFGEQRRDINFRRAKFFKDEGIAGVINTSPTSMNGLVFAQSAGPWDAKQPLAPPTYVVNREQYNRMVRLIRQKIPVTMRLNLQADISNRNEDVFNVIGEIPGGAKKDEVIMIGAHLDSWHSGTGATDNAAGSAVMIEVMRILKTLNLKLDRTVRIGLWTGEELGLYGSKGYVKEHLGDHDTMRLTQAHAKFSGYFNLDNGSGKIRGVYLQGNDAMRPLFEQWLAPFRDEGVTTVTIRGTGGTDHLSFDEVGLPGFQFLQDPLDYNTQTHHSQMDTYDHVQPADLMQASAVIATVVYNAANRGEILPRKPLPGVPVRLPVK
ncbi:MAG: M20/M25/M40 family metallo-hydrolase [Bryobacteraceae bacterium]